MDLISDYAVRVAKVGREWDVTLWSEHYGPEPLVVTWAPTRAEALAYARAVRLIFAAAGGAPAVPSSLSTWRPLNRALASLKTRWTTLADSYLDGSGRVRSVPRTWVRLQPIVADIISDMDWLKR